MKTFIVSALLVAGGAVLPAPGALINAGFDTGDFTGWATFGQGWRTGVGDDARSGSHGMVNDVLVTDGDNFRGIFQEVAVTEGATYSAGVYIRTVNLQSSESWFELQWLNNSGGVIEQLQSGHVSADQVFSLMAIGNIVAPAGAVTASVRGIVFMPEPPPDDADFHIFDDFFLIQHDDLDLDITAGTAGDVVIHWSTNATVLQLEFSTNIHSSAWSAVPETPVVSGDRWVVTNTAGAPEIIYRLNAP